MSISHKFDFEPIVQTIDIYTLSDNEKFTYNNEH